MANTIPVKQAGAERRLAAHRRSFRWLRLIPLAIAAVAMALGLWAGLLRLGVPVPAGPIPSTDLHGALMISGFLGTVISLERAVALGRGLAYATPVLSAAGALLLFANAPPPAAIAFVAASIMLLIATGTAAYRLFGLFTMVLAFGAACWGFGTLLWLAGRAMPEVTGWWLNFLILTVAAERLELSRLVRVSLLSQAIFLILVLLLLIGAARGELAEAPAPYTAAGLIGLAAWLIRHDIARRTIRHAGQPRFSASCILAGHVWLAISGLVLAFGAWANITAAYDAAVHAVALGFVFSMVFGHAPIILPAITGMHMRFSRAAYVSLALLHVSVLARVASDVLEFWDLRAGSGLLTVVALATYAATLIAASWRRPAST